MDLPSTGDIFEGRYDLQQMLGQGGFAVVFLARDQRTQRQVVLKVLSPNLDGAYPTTLVSRFEREAKIFGALDHPNIVTMFDFGRTPAGLLYMVFEHVRGRDLAEVLMVETRLEPGVMAHILRQLLEALREAHQQGILHRDLKPPNVLLHNYAGDPYRVKLIDFGIARDITPDAPRLTKTGNVVGTLRYMAPEQMFGEPVTPASDIFSLGLVAWEMLTGKPAIRGQSQAEMVVEQASAAPFALPVEVAPRELREVVERMIAREVADRFSSADAVLAAMRGAMHRQPVEVEPRSAPQPLHAASRLPLLAATAALVILGAIAAAVLKDDEAPRPVALRTDAAAAGALLKTSREENTVEAPAPVAPVVSDPENPCGKKPKFRGVGRARFDSFETGMPAYVPTSYDPNKPSALVVGFHRRLQNGNDFLHDTELTEQAEKHRWIIIAPDAKGIDWPTDPAILLDAIDLATSKFCIDRSQLHLIGDEGGANYVQEMLCKLPLSSVTVTFPVVSRMCEPRTKTAFLRLYTTQDRVHRADGSGCSKILGKFGSWSSLERGIRSAYACGADGDPWEKYPESCSILSDCTTGTALMCGFDGGHRWPKSSGQLIPLSECADDPETTAPLAAAVGDFITEFAHPLSEAEVAEIDAALHRDAP